MVKLAIGTGNGGRSPPSLATSPAAWCPSARASERSPPLSLLASPASGDPGEAELRVPTRAADLCAPSRFSGTVDAVTSASRSTVPWTDPPPPAPEPPRRFMLGAAPAPLPTGALRRGAPAATAPWVFDAEGDLPPARPPAARATTLFWALGGDLPGLTRGVPRPAAATWGADRRFAIDAPGRAPDRLAKPAGTLGAAFVGGSAATLARAREDTGFRFAFGAAGARRFFPARMTGPTVMAGPSSCQRRRAVAPGAPKSKAAPHRQPSRPLRPARGPMGSSPRLKASCPPSNIAADETDRDPRPAPIGTS